MRNPYWMVATIALCCVQAVFADTGGAPRGQQLYEARCGACHSVEDNRVGPAHHGVYGRKAGSAKDYDYSVAVKASKVVWTERTLDRWLTDPEKLIPGKK